MGARPDVVVVGAGIVGLCAAYALTERGAEVRVVERGVPGNGQSGGGSRIFRHAHDDARLVRAAVASRALYREWSARLGVEMVSDDGAVAVGAPVEGRMRMLADAPGVRARRLDGATLAALHPLLARFDGPAMIDETGGSIRTVETVAALAGALGDRLVHDEVLALRPLPSGAVEVTAGGGTLEAGAVVVCAGRGGAALARGLGMSPPVDHGAHVRLTFRVRGEPPTRLPCLQDGSGAFGETGVYAAGLPGNREYAVGLSESVPVGEDGSVIDRDGLAALAARTRAYVERALPGLDPDPVGSRTCWTTQLPWGPDGLAAWSAEGVHVLVGHNLFKQAPGVGRALAAMALGDEPALDLRPGARLGARAGAAQGSE